MQLAVTNPTISSTAARRSVLNGLDSYIVLSNLSQDVQLLSALPALVSFDFLLSVGFVQKRRKIWFFPAAIVLGYVCLVSCLFMFWLEIGLWDKEEKLDFNNEKINFRNWEGLRKRDRLGSDMFWDWRMRRLSMEWMVIWFWVIWSVVVFGSSLALRTLCLMLGIRRSVGHSDQKVMTWGTGQNEFKIGDLACWSRGGLRLRVRFYGDISGPSSILARRGVIFNRSFSRRCWIAGVGRNQNILCKVFYFSAPFGLSIVFLLMIGCGAGSCRWRVGAHWEYHGLQVQRSWIEYGHDGMTRFIWEQILYI